MGTLRRELLDHVVVLGERQPDPLQTPRRQRTGRLARRSPDDIAKTLGAVVALARSEGFAPRGAGASTPAEPRASRAHHPSLTWQRERPPGRRESQIARDAAQAPDRAWQCVAHDDERRDHRSPERQPGDYDIQQGQVAGRISTHDFQAFMGNFRDPFDRSTYLCGTDPTFQAFRPNMCQAADLMHGPSLDSTDAGCDAISIVIGFNAVAAKVGAPYAGKPVVQGCDGSVVECIP